MDFYLFKINHPVFAFTWIIRRISTLLVVFSCTGKPILVINEGNRDVADASRNSPQVLGPFESR